MEWIRRDDEGVCQKATIKLVDTYLQNWKTIGDRAQKYLLLIEGTQKIRSRQVATVILFEARRIDIGDDALFESKVK